VQEGCLTNISSHHNGCFIKLEAWDWNFLRKTAKRPFPADPCAVRSAFWLSGGSAGHVPCLPSGSACTHLNRAGRWQWKRPFCHKPCPRQSINWSTGALEWSRRPAHSTTCVSNRRSPNRTCGRVGSQRVTRHSCECQVLFQLLPSEPRLTTFRITRLSSNLIREFWSIVTAVLDGMMTWEADH
jgi:hypothetical protein